MELAHEAEANVSDLLALECEAHTSALRQRRVQCVKRTECVLMQRWCSGCNQCAQLLDRPEPLYISTRNIPSSKPQPVLALPRDGRVWEKPSRLHSRNLSDLTRSHKANHAHRTGEFCSGRQTPLIAP